MVAGRTCRNRNTGQHIRCSSGHAGNIFYNAFENFNISDSDISFSVENNNDEKNGENKDINKNTTYLNNNIDKNDINNMHINNNSIFEQKNIDAFNDINNAQNNYFNLGID